LIRYAVRSHASDVAVRLPMADCCHRKRGSSNMDLTINHVAVIPRHVPPFFAHGPASDAILGSIPGEHGS